MNKPADWESLESKFAQLRSETAIEHHPNHADPPSKIVALREVEPGGDKLGRPQGTPF